MGSLGFIYNPLIIAFEAPSRRLCEQEMDQSFKSDRDVSMEHDRSEQEGIIPSRPSSRLDFNAEDGPDALKPLTSLSQTIDMSEPRTSVNDVVCMTSASQPSPLVLEGSLMHREGGLAPFRPRDQPAEDVVRPPSAKDTSRSPGAPRTKPTSVSRLCFPFVMTSPRRKKAPPPTPPIRHKYSCFPTKLSPFPAERPSTMHKRHNYGNHGHSRLALDYAKWFWSIREEEWRGTKEAGTSKTCDAALPTTITTVHPKRIAVLCEPNASQETSLPISINPRRGDISALRDPYCVEVDRSSMVLPAWTIAKALWMYDLCLALANRCPAPQISWDEDVSDVESDLELDMSTSCSSISDDSEGTLVDVDSEESDYFSPGNRLLPAEEKGFLLPELQIACSSVSTTPAISPPSSPLPSQQNLDQIPQCLSAKVVRHRDHHFLSKFSWAATSYSRWEILKSLLHNGPDGRPKFSDPALQFY